MVVWSGGTLTPGTAITRPTENICGNSTCLKTPQYFKEGRLKPFFANNVDIPFARARRLMPCPRKATVRSGKQPNAYVAVYRFCVKNNNLLVGRVIAMVFDGTSSAQAQSQNLRKEPYKKRGCSTFGTALLFFSFSSHPTQKTQHYGKTAINFRIF